MNEVEVHGTAALSQIALEEASQALYEKMLWPIGEMTQNPQLLVHPSQAGLAWRLAGVFQTTLWNIVQDFKPGQWSFSIWVASGRYAFESTGQG